MIGRLFKINAQTDLMQLASAKQQFTTDRLNMPGIFYLFEEVICQLRYAICLIGIDDKPTLNVSQRAAADI